MVKHIEWYTLNTCSSLCVNYISKRLHSIFLSEQKLVKLSSKALHWPWLWERSREYRTWSGAHRERPRRLCYSPVYPTKRLRLGPPAPCPCSAPPGTEDGRAWRLRLYVVSQPERPELLHTQYAGHELELRASSASAGRGCLMRTKSKPSPATTLY